jgi:signal transduction histidine kinase
MPAERQLKVLIIGGTVALTVAIHYGWVLEPIFGPSHWIHAIHGRFCYIPIVIAAAWFGLSGGVYTASAISLLVLPFIIGGDLSSHNLAQELVEIVFYFAIAVLAGWLFQRELFLRRKQEQTQLQLERSNKLSMVGQMAASVAHEIKNPLASIKGALEILSDDTTPATDREEFKETAIKEIRRIDGTISEFLEFARPRQSRLERLDLSETLRTSLKQIEVHSSKAGLQLVNRINDNIYIRGDRDKVHQVILNLLINAIQASSSGSAIEIHLKESENSRAILTIRDHGRGMTPNELSRIFEPFYSTKPSGTGLGLAIVKGIVDNHSGDIAFESASGHGTTATVIFPAFGD